MEAFPSGKTSSDHARVRVRMDTSGTDYYDESKVDFTIASVTCPLTLIYGEYSDELERMRYFRDNILRKTPAGQEIIRLYYQWSPLLLKTMEEDEGFKEEVTEIADGVLEIVGEVN